MYPQMFTWRHSPGLREVVIALLFVSLVAPGFAYADTEPDPPPPPPPPPGPTLTSVVIASNNAASAQAKVGDIVTITFTASEAIDTPSATILGNAASIVNTGGDTYTASYTLLASDAEVVITFTIDFNASGGGFAGRQVIDVTDSSSVTFDKTAPVVAPHEDVNAEATSSSGAIISYTSPTADDGSAVSCLPASGTTFALGPTTVACNASDAAGNAATAKTFTASVVDTTAPVITLTGATSVSLTVGQTFTDEGATTADIVDGAGTADVSGSVNTSSAGTYTLTYDKTDAAGNHAAAVTRTVTVNAAPAPPAPSSSGGGGGSGNSLYPVAPVLGAVPLPAPPVPPVSAPVSPRGSVLGAQTTNIVSSGPVRIVSSSRPAAIAVRAPVAVRDAGIEANTTNPAQVAAAASTASAGPEKIEWPAQIATVEYGIGQLEPYFPWFLLLLLILFALIVGSWVWRKYKEHKKRHEPAL